MLGSYRVISGVNELLDHTKTYGDSSLEWKIGDRGEVGGDGERSSALAPTMSCVCNVSERGW